MKTYFNLYYYSFMSILTYPMELFFTFLDPVLWIGFLALFWNVVSQNSVNPISLTNILAYFILVKVISLWAFHPDELNFSRYLGRVIKDGELSKILVKPLKILPAMVFEYSGYWAVDLAFSFVLFGIAIKMLGGIALIQLVWFLVFLVLSFIITYSISILVASIAFVTKEINGICHSVSHMIRILAGAWVPLMFFPERTRELLSLTPFPTMIFAPINILQKSSALDTIYRDFAVGIFWSVILYIAAILVWKNNMKKYEATGL